MTGEKGFSLIEILAGVMIFSFGMLGVGAMLTATVRDNSFSSGLSEATLLASSQMDILLAVPYANTMLIEDADGDGADGAAGLEDDTEATADGFDLDQGKNGKFDLYWNVSPDDPMSGSKTINVIVKWGDRDNANRRLSFRMIRGE